MPSMLRLGNFLVNDFSAGDIYMHDTVLQNYKLPIHVLLPYFILLRIAITEHRSLTSNTFLNRA
jgi:hypothetical protein